MFHSYLFCKSPALPNCVCLHVCMLHMFLCVHVLRLYFEKGPHFLLPVLGRGPLLKIFISSCALQLGTKLAFLLERMLLFFSVHSRATTTQPSPTLFYSFFSLNFFSQLLKEKPLLHCCHLFVGHSVFSCGTHTFSFFCACASSVRKELLKKDISTTRCLRVCVRPQGEKKNL